MQCDGCNAKWALTGNAPVADSIDPDHGDKAGGTEVTITGNNFDEGIVVKFDTTAAVITSRTQTEIVCTTPAHASGAVAVKFQNRDSNELSKAAFYTFDA